MTKIPNKTSLTQIILAGALATVLSACGDKPEMKKNEDLTGDGIVDVLIYANNGATTLTGDYLFIGQGNGEFIRAKGMKTEDGTRYFITDDKVAYFFNGKFYQKSEKETQTK